MNPLNNPLTTRRSADGNGKPSNHLRGAANRLPPQNPRRKNRREPEEQMMRTTILIIFLALIGCRNRKEAIPATCAADYDSPVSVAALTGVFDTVEQYDVYYIAHRPEAKFEELANEQRQIDSVRAWASNLPDSCVRYWYTYWLDNSQNKLNAAKAMLAKNKTVPEPPFPRVR